MIYTIGIIISAFLAILLLTKRDKTIADKTLFIWLCITTLHLTIFAINSSGEYRGFPYLLGWEIPLPLVHGPFLFLYATAFTASTKTVYKLLHFIPFVLAVLLISPFLALGYQDKILVYQNGGTSFQTETVTIFIASLISGIVYCLLTLRVLFLHKRSIKDRFSYTEKINLQWLFNLTAGLSCIWVIAIFATDKYIFISVVLYVLFIGYFGIKQVGIFTNPLPKTVPSVPAEDGEITAAETLFQDSKYEKSLLPDQQIESIYLELLHLMVEEKLFLTPGLTLSMLSQRLAVHPNTLSQVINRRVQKNFFDYINTLRVEEFKARVAKVENQQFTLLSLAYDCGFNSKTSFNRNFKSITGQSPSAYLKAAQINLKE